MCFYKEFEFFIVFVREEEPRKDFEIKSLCQSNLRFHARNLL